MDLALEQPLPSAVLLGFSDIFALGVVHLLGLTNCHALERCKGLCDVATTKSASFGDPEWLWHLHGTSTLLDR